VRSPIRKALQPRASANGLSPWDVAEEILLTLGSTRAL
jgi:hypothetical protein